MTPTVFTIGHSNQPLPALLDALTSNGIERLADVRRFPMSRRNPWFNAESLAESLAEVGIAYIHLSDLGGRRPVLSQSANAALRNAGFRGYADYMATPAFEAALDGLIVLAAEQRTAIMCAEAVPWRCHRSLISDALLARGVEVQHIVSGKPRAATLSPVAHVGKNGAVKYPALL